MEHEWWLEINKKLTYLKAYYHTPSVTAKKNYFYVQGTGHFQCERQFFLHRKEYRSILVKYTINGCGVLRYRDKTYELKKGSLFIIDCFDYQEYYTGDCEFWENKWVHFYGGASLEYFHDIFEQYGPVIQMTEDTKIPSMIDELSTLIEKSDVQFEIKSSLILLEILTCILLTASAQKTDIHASKTCELVTSSCRFIEHNYQRNLTVFEIANSVNLSQYYFSRVFRRITGFSPYEYLMKYRLNIAKSLLYCTELSVETISEKTGFSDSGSLIRAFKHYEQITPLQYRKLL
jgi:AraC-type DNA-binding domain-containing proteins